MKKFRNLAAIAFALAFSAHALAQDNVVKISTGSATGTYSKIFKSIQSLCGTDLQLVEVPSTGSDQNIDNLVNKVADAGFVQTDTLQFTAMNDPRASDSQIRVLVPLYPEEVHVIALKTLAKGGNWLGSVTGGKIGSVATSLSSLSDLENVKVGAWGGSYTTARAISYLGSVKYEVVQFDDAAKAKAALDKGEIAAIIAVGGQPLGFASSLNTNYKLLKIDSALADKVKAYQKARITYKNISQDSVDTIAARSMLVVKNYASPDRKAKFATLKACITKNETEFKEGTCHHPKWGDVDLAAPVSWAMYDVGSVAAPAAPTKKK